MASLPKYPFTNNGKSAKAGVRSMLINDAIKATISNPFQESMYRNPALKSSQKEASSPASAMLSARSGWGIVKKNVNIPLIVGGGIRTKANAVDAVKAGANVIVTGTIIERDSSKHTIEAIIEGIKNANGKS